MADDQLVFESFEPHVGTDFTVVHGGDTPIILNLLEAKMLKVYAGADETMRAPFSLLFQSAFQQVMPQQMFRLSHAAMGEVDIFLVPTAKNETGIQYFATFN